MGMTNPLNAYRETRVRTASPGQVVVMLYSEAVRRLDIALDLLDKGTKKQPGAIEKINESAVKAQEIVTELMASLDFDSGGEIAQNLFSLYAYFNRELLEANIGKDAERMRKIRNMIEELRGAWVVAVSQSQNQGQTQSGVNIAG